MRSFEGLSIRAVVFIGFGLITVLWLLAWYQLSLQIGEARSRASATNMRHNNAQETLASIRARVLMASVAFRDVLLDPDPANTSGYRRQLDQAFREIDEMQRQYVPVTDSSRAREELALLRTEIDGYRSAMHEVLATDRRRWLAEARSLLSQRVTPRRDIVIAISEEVQTLNRSAYVQRQVEIADIYRSVQRTLWELLGLALAIGIGVAIVAVTYAGQLERRLRRQMAKDVELTGDLQELSAKLITVQEEERRYIARELHDEIGQALTAIKVELAYAQRSIDERGGPIDALQDVRSITDGALNQVRDLSYLLHPAALDEFGLVAAVDSHMKTFGKRHNLLALLSHDHMSARLSAEVEAAAYRIIQEALTNVARHAHAKTCRVYLGLVNDALKIRIEDDGAGFDADAVRSGERKGLGLIGIRERAAHLKGTVAFESTPGRGTCVIVDLPARVRAEEADFELVPNQATA
jgi:signal transduction histidine kinase